MSWRFTATGDNKTEVLKNFDRQVEQDSYCQPKEAIKQAARTLTDHLGEDAVVSLKTFGHTSEDGSSGNVAVQVNLP
jgi:hypothetical protein